MQRRVLLLLTSSSSILACNNVDDCVLDEVFCKLEQVECHHLSSLLASLRFYCLASADANKNKTADRNACSLKAHLEGGSGVLPLFWAICMLVVQLQHLVIEQLQEVNLQCCSWKPICSLGKYGGCIT